MLTPVALALHEVRQLLSTARGKLLRSANRGKSRLKQAGRVEAFEESEIILQTAVTVQQEADVARAQWSARGIIVGLRNKGEGEPPERVVVPFASKGRLFVDRENGDPDQT